MSYVTIVVGDKSTGQILDGDSGFSEPNPDLVFVPLTGGFAVGNLVWVSDDDSPGELGEIEAIDPDVHLDLVDNLAHDYTMLQNAKVVLARDISSDAIDVDTWRNRLTCIGTCKMRLDNLNNKYEGLFAPDDSIIISINGTIVWAGLMDDVRPYLPKKGVLTNELIMTGRDYGRYLVDNSFTKKYPTGWAADIVDDILSILGDPLLYTDDGEYGGEAQIKYEGTRAKLGDALREICELSGRDFYIDNNGRLHLFEAGQSDSTVDLFLLVDDPTNKLLTFEEYEQVGTSIKNSIEIHAGSVKDHYSDGNSGDLSVGGAGAVADSATHIYGSQSIQLTCTGPATVFLEFDQNPVLADYGYSGSVDLSKLCEAKVMLRGTRTGETKFSLRPFLVDGGGNKIVFCRVGPDSAIGGKGGSKGWTENIVTWDHRAFWTQLSYPLGAHDSNPIKPGPGLTTGFWCADTGDITFDWTDVVDVGFEYPFAENAVILIDGWCIPSIEAKSIQQNAASQHPVTGYGKRMYSQFRKEMRTQKQIILYAKQVLALRKDPIQKFKGVAKGQVGTKYAAQSVDVEVTAYVIDAPYTITALHHKLHHGSDIRGWDFLTEYELAAQDAPATIILRDDNPLEVGMDQLALENRGYKGGMEAEDSLLGDVQSGRFTQETRGTPFALYPADGDLHWLTADLNDVAITGFQYYGVAGGVLYTYDDSVPKWIRAPCELGRRAGDPPAGAGGGEYTGDTYYNTTDSQVYQWTGAAWEAIASMDLGDLSGEVAAGQLAIEQRDWHSNLNFIWDYPNKDWDEIWWGIAGDEKNTNATIEFSDGTTVVVNKGTEAALADGAYIYYWNDALVPGGPYTLVRDTFANWDNGVGAGKGIIFVVVIDEAGANPPSFYPFNSYMATVGVGMLSAWTVKTHHLTAEQFYGKDIGTQINVGTANAGIRMLGDVAQAVIDGDIIGDAIAGAITPGIWGFKAGPIRTFYLDPATGVIWVYGAGMFGLKTYPGNVTLGYLDATIVDLGLGTGNQNTLVVRTALAGQVLMLESGGRPIYLDEATDQILLGDGWNNMRPMTDGNVDLGTNLVMFGDIWGVVKYSDLNLLDTHCPRCGERFKFDEDIKFIIIAVETLDGAEGTTYEQIRCIPAHARCSPWARIKKWMRRNN